MSSDGLDPTAKLNLLKSQIGLERIVLNTVFKDELKKKISTEDQIASH